MHKTCVWTLNAESLCMVREKLFAGEGPSPLVLRGNGGKAETRHSTSIAPFFHKYT